MMNRSVSNMKCLVLWLLLFALGTAFAGPKVESPSPSGAGTWAPNALSAARDRRALEAYQKRNAEIAPRSEDAVPASTDNAALLYYQAFLYRPEPYDAIKYDIYPGTEFTGQIRAYMGRCLPMIEIVETASRIPKCTWGAWSKGAPWAPFRGQLVKVRDILLTDATILATDRRYRVALERCLTVRRLAGHLSEDPQLFRYEHGSDKAALNTIRDVLGMMPPDGDILTWLRDQFAAVPGPRLSFAKTLQAQINSVFQDIETNSNAFNICKDLAVAGAKSQTTKEEIQSLTNEQFILRARDGLSSFTDSIFRILDSDATYKEKFDLMHHAINEKMEDDTIDPVAKTIVILPGANLRVQIDLGYPIHVEHVALINATKAAVEIYLVLAKTGKLPEELPDHLPEDPFTNKNFGYETTSEGFALRCQGREYQTRLKSLLEYKVRR